MKAHIRHSAPLLLFGLCILGLLMADSLYTPVSGQTADGIPEQVTLTPNPDRSEVPLRTASNGYLSPITEADKPFTHMLLRWEASQPVEDALVVEVRTSLDGNDWTDWHELGEDDDLWMPEDGPDVHWSEVLYAGEGARFWQVRTSHGRLPADDEPTLHNIEVNTVDARYGEDRPAYDHRSAPDSIGLASSGVSKPPVISRSGWGCPDGQWSRAAPAYRAVTHMVIHHTAGSNSLRAGESSWADRVRAIWSFHTITRGWGDIGYNYIIDPNGVIYEGRSGGDNAVGFHDAANYGSMGVSLIGTYETVNPTGAAQNSLVEVLAWKASQRGIDPLGWSYYYGCDISNYCTAPGAVVANISGHRNIMPGQTSCPGQAAYNLLPHFRERVRNRMDNSGPITKPDNGDLVIDNLEDSFARSDANWYTAACGYDNYTYYTYTTDNQAESTNSATWRPNIPSDGYYRVYAYVPQGCGVASPPYATTQAEYRIVHRDGVTTHKADHNTAQEWVDLGAYYFNAGNNGAVELFDYPAEPYSQRKVMFFDTIRWEPEEEPEPSEMIELVNVQYDRTTLAAGELLKVTFTVRNNGEVPIHGQAPQAGTFDDGSFNLADSYVYDEGECFAGDGSDTYPIYQKEGGRFRVMLGPTNRAINCTAGTGGYPWRWGINGTMQPGETRDIVGHIRFRVPGTVQLQAGVIQEYVDYFGQGAAPTTINVTPERTAPVPISYSPDIQPVAHVYRMGDIPFNFLHRTSNSLSIPRGDYLGDIPWNGSLINWGSGGPFNTSDRFIIEQTRVFHAPASGVYTFRTTTDDGSWLWVDGQRVVSNHGTHGMQQVTGDIYLEEGPHVLSFKYFEYVGDAVAGYAIKQPGATAFVPAQDDFSRIERIGSTFLDIPDVVVGACDLGGSGAATMRYSWDGGTWVDSPGDLLSLGQMNTGSYTLRYKAIDNAGNESAEHQLRFTVNPNLEVQRIFLPTIH
jgi:hypothetical protein